MPVGLTKNAGWTTKCPAMVFDPCAIVVILFAGLPPVHRGTSGEASSLESSAVLVYRTLIPVSTSVSFSSERATTGLSLAAWFAWFALPPSFGRGVKERPSPFLPSWCPSGGPQSFPRWATLRVSDGVAPRDTAGWLTSSPDASCDFTQMASTWEGEGGTVFHRSRNN